MTDPRPFHAVHADADRARRSLHAQLDRKTPAQLTDLVAHARADAPAADHPRERELLLELAVRAERLAPER
jgi:hypothetical protein